MWPVWYQTYQGIVITKPNKPATRSSWNRWAGLGLGFFRFVFLFLTQARLVTLQSVGAH